LTIFTFKNNVKKNHSKKGGFMIDYIRNFMELFFPGIEEYWDKPSINLYREIKSKRTEE
jgi:hypothetical protein